VSKFKQTVVPETNFHLHLSHNLELLLSNPYPLTAMTLQVYYLQYLSGVGRDSVVGIATRYGLDGLGIESQ
jgi:hypothetical protein